MRNVEQIQERLIHKEQLLTKNQLIITPDSGISPEVQATWMIDLLQAVYTEHGIAKSPEKVIEAIAAEKCRCWFILEDDVPIALTALITQSDGSVELGRAVSLKPGQGLGGITMLRAGLDQIEHGNTALVAEVRVADTFLGIPSGEATQKIMFGLLGLKPHALAPMFNHGNPVRQEMFALGTSQENRSSAEFIIPDNRNARNKLLASAQLNANIFSNATKEHKIERGNSGFEIVQKEPFSILVPSVNGSSLPKIDRMLFDKNNFSLLPIELNPSNTKRVVECLESGWIPCGVDRNLGEQGHPVLLFGKLKNGTLLSPTKIVEQNIGVINTKALNTIDDSFRKNAARED